jgi:hypothetical protein
MDNQKNPIYFVTVLTEQDRAHFSRCWAWFPTLEEAEKSVYEDVDFYMEHGHYKYIVIEAVKSRSIVENRNPVWFGAPYKDGKYTVTRLSGAPEGYKYIRNLSIG